MNYIFLGGFIPDSIVEKVQSNTKKGFQSAANNFQLSFIDGLIQNNIDVKLITAYFIGFYPINYSKIIINDGDVEHKGLKVKTSFFINLPFIKNFFKYFSLYFNLKNTIKKEETNYILIYSLNLAYVLSSVVLKKLNNNIKICVCVTDLHEFPADTNIFYRLYLKYFEKPILGFCYKNIDKYIFLTENLTEKIFEADYYVMEGIFSVEQNEVFHEYDKLFIKDKTILYTGTLDSRYGINQLLEVFNLIPVDEGIKLIICGDGNKKEVIKELCKLNSSIVFLGRLNFKKIKYLQTKATILINPRSNQGDYNRYSFPSKTMEYLASGRPVLMHKLDGIPNEYDDYLHYFSSNNSVEMRDDILKLLNNSNKDLYSMGEHGKKFIINNKGSKYQISKILNFLNS